MPENQSPDDYLRKLRSEQGYMPIGDHFEELRKRLIRSLLYVFVLSIVSFFFYELIWQFLMGPVAALVNRDDGIPVKIIATKLTEFFAVNLKSTIFAGVLLATPLIILEIWSFLLPAFQLKSRKWGWIIVIFGTLLFWAGIAFCRSLIWEQVAELLVFGWAPPGIAMPGNGNLVNAELHVVISDYLAMFFAFHFAFGASFEMPVVSLFLGLMGILKSAMFIKNWRIAVLVIAVISATLTPADVFSMLAMMLPLFVLYIISGFIVAAVETKE